LYEPKQKGPHAAYTYRLQVLFIQRRKRIEKRTKTKEHGYPNYYLLFSLLKKTKGRDYVP
jgi:hypothetical protein